MSLDRRSILRGLGAIGGIGLVGTAQAEGSTPDEPGHAQPRERDIERTLQVTQEPDKSVHWVLPGKRRLSEAVFGTPDNPQFGQSLLEHKIAQTDNENVAALLEELPLPVAVPEGIRETEDGAFTTTSVPTPFSDKTKQTSGELEVTYLDRGGASYTSNETDTNDEAEIDVQFDDPAGNTSHSFISCSMRTPSVSADYGE